MGLALYLNDPWARACGGLAVACGTGAGGTAAAAASNQAREEAVDGETEEE